MNRLEFKEVLNSLDIYNPLTTTEGRYNKLEDVHYWNDLAMHFDGRDCAIVKGRIPLEVAMIIYQKYPGNPYGIIVDGGKKNNNPIDYAVDKKYEKEIRDYSDENNGMQIFLKKCAQAERNLKRRKKIDDKYIKTYHIDSKEGLLIFLTEMKDYILRKNNLPETEVEKSNELLANVTSSLLKKVNPYISAYDWMQDDVENKDTYNLSNQRYNKTKLGQIFREAVLDFDKSVNPFLNNEVELDEIKNYLNGVRIDAYAYDYYKDGIQRKGCCSLKITDLSTDNNTIYERMPDGFSFELSYKLGEDYYLEFRHSYLESHYDSNCGETVVINYHSNKPEEAINMVFNITQGKAGDYHDDDKISATPEQIAFVYDELLKATGYASSITIENMKKKSNSKQSVILKQ